MYLQMEFDNGADMTVNDETEAAVLMLVMGWVFKWDLHSVDEVGGNGRANDICIHDRVLYEAEPAGVISWQTGRFLPKTTDNWATALCSHDGHLYHSVATGPSSTDPSHIYQSLTGKLVAKRKYLVQALCSHGGRLFDGGMGGVYDTFANRRLTDRQVNAVCSHGERLYDGGFMGLYETLEGAQVACRESEIVSLCSHAGVLYDAVQHLSPQVPGSIYNSLQGVVALDYTSINHTTKTRTVMGHTIEGGRQNVYSVNRMISAPSALISLFAAPLGNYKKNIGR